MKLNWCLNLLIEQIEGGEWVEKKKQKKKTRLTIM